jgi:alanine racemase
MTPGRWAWAEIDLDALEHNVGVLRRAAAPAAVWAVVKADAYGHGAIAVAATALAAGAGGLCVALVQEGAELRAAGIDAPVLVLSEQPTAQVAELMRYRLTPTVYTLDYLDALTAVGDPACAVHVKVDTGMQRVGVASERAAELIRHVCDRAPAVQLAGVYTHLACADEPESPANQLQLDRFDAVLAELRGAGIDPPMVHVANSAAALAIADARRSVVRAGIALYGISPGAGVDHLVGELRPVLALKAKVSLVKRVSAGSAVSYGWRHRFQRETTVATLPIGYADGVPRRLGTLPDRPGADVLIGGRACPIVGVVTMDQTIVDVGDGDVAIGDEAVLIGEQGGLRVRAEDWAERLDTIGYEIVCGIGRRVPRVRRGGIDAGAS